MVSMLATLFFTAVFGVAVWTIVATIRPQFERIQFLLRYGPVPETPLPGQQRVMLRGRAVPVRVTPVRHRAAA
jgi:hypothetical protein